jgi:hypothetical protein
LGEWQELNHASQVKQLDPVFALQFQMTIAYWAYNALLWPLVEFWYISIYHTQFALKIFCFAKFSSGFNRLLRNYLFVNPAFILHANKILSTLLVLCLVKRTCAEHLFMRGQEEEKL